MKQLIEPHDQLYYQHIILFIVKLTDNYVQLTLHCVIVSNTLKLHQRSVRLKLLVIRRLCSFI